MNVYLKIYKFCDADMYAVHGAGISVPGLMKLALYYRVRGRIVHISIPECLTYDLEGKKRSISMQVNITDPASVKFLQTALKPRQRTAFLKVILRDSMLDQVTGVFLKDEMRIRAEHGRLGMSDYSHMPDLLVCKKGDFHHSYLPLVQNSTLGPDSSYTEPVQEPEAAPKKKAADISDLAPKTELIIKNRKKEEEKTRRTRKKPAAKPQDETDEEENLFEEMSEGMDSPAPPVDAEDGYEDEELSESEARDAFMDVFMNLSSDS